MRQHNYKGQTEEKQLAKADELIADMPDFAKSFFTRLKNDNKASGTILAYAYDLHMFFEYLNNTAGFKDKDIKRYTVDILDLLTIDDLDEFLASLKYSPNGRARMSSTLRNFYLHFNKRQDIKTNPAAMIGKTKIAHTEIVTLTKNEVSQILDAILSPDTPGKPHSKRRAKTLERDYAIIFTLLGTGMRVSELVGLDLQDVDMNNNCLHIIRKGGNEDKVYFSQEVKEAIEDYWGDPRNDLAPDEENKEALFISYAHKRITVRSVENLVKKYSIKASLGKKITPHKFRSTFGTHLYEETGDIYLVASALGHSSVETTQKRYSKQSEKNKMRAAEASSSLFKNND